LQLPIALSLFVFGRWRGLVGVCSVGNLGVFGRWHATVADHGFRQCNGFMLVSVLALY
jgi:hypothetical protein